MLYNDDNTSETESQLDEVICVDKDDNIVLVERDLYEDIHADKSESEKLGISEAKSAGKFRRWMLTIPAAGVLQEDIEKKLARYRGYAGQLEEGKKKKDGSGQGYLHYQVYVDHSEPIKFETLKNKFPKAHLEVARESAAVCVAYVTKEDTRRGESFSGGVIDLEEYQGKRNDLEVMRQRIIDGERVEDLIFEDARAIRNAVALQQFQLLVDERMIPRQREVKAHFVSGKTGVGKSRSVWEKYDYDLRRLYSVSEYKHGAWDQYSAHEAVLLDEFRGQWTLSFMLRLLDRYPLLLPARYRNRQAGFTEVWVLSNVKFEDLYKDVDERSRQALRRRFDSIGEMMDDGSIQYERFDGEEIEHGKVAK